MAVYDKGSSQGGDEHIENLAGGNIGVTGAEIRQILEGQQEFGMSMVAAYEKAYSDLSGQIRELAKAQREAERDAAMERGIDFESRLKRQAALDARLSLMIWWLVLLSVVVCGAVAIEVWLVVDRGDAAGLVRAAFDLGLLGRRP